MGTISEDLPPDMLAFIVDKMNSFVKWDVVRFLKENPNVADTYAGLARYVGRKPEAIEAPLEEMAADGLLEVRTVEKLRVFSLTRDQEARDLIERFMDACGERRFRLRAVYHVAKGMR